jgi:hypothetical protein
MAKAEGALVPNKGGAVAVYDYGADAGAGFEGVTGKDLSIPFINVLQAMSPEVEDQTIEGAKPGLFLNTVSKELIDGDKGFVYQPCHIDEVYVEWKKRDNAGGGLVGMHDPLSEIVKNAQRVLKEKTGKPFGKMEVNGNDLVHTAYVYGLLLDEAALEASGFAVMSFSSTKFTPFKDWRTAMYMLKGKPPIFANRARIKTFKDKNDKGTFFNVAIAPALGRTWQESLIPPNESGAALLKSAKEFQDMVRSGKAKADFTQAAPGGAGTEGSGAAPF